MHKALAASDSTFLDKSPHVIYTNDMRPQKKPAHAYVFPEWSNGNKRTIFACSLTGLTGAAAGCWLLHTETYGGLLAWHIGLGSLGVCLYWYLKGKYEQYMDYGWDTYY